MIVVDLFSGLGGWTSAFKDRGHDIFTVDVDPDFNPDLCIDIFNLTPSNLPNNPTAILASPPCNRFSILTISQSWDAIKSESHPRKEATLMAIGLVAKTLHIIREINPPYWIIENPVGMLRKTIGPPHITTYFCAWNGGGFKKPTDLWGVLPKINWPKPKEWTKSPGITQGSENHHWGKYDKYDSAERAKIPYKLSEALCIAIENELVS